MHLDLIVGLPLDEWEDIKFSFESVFALHPSELQLGFLKFYEVLLCVISMRNMDMSLTQILLIKL